MTASPPADTPIATTQDRTRVLVCGGRNYSDADKMNSVMDSIHAEAPISILIYGMARGADDMAKMWATARGVKRLGFPADWERYGRAAGPKRNQRMLDEGKPDLVVAFPGGSGTQDCVRRAKAAGVQVIEVPPK